MQLKFKAPNNTTLEILNADGSLVTSKTSQGYYSDTITQNLVVGTYYLHLLTSNTEASYYDFTLLVTPPDYAGNDQSSAKDLGTLTAIPTESSDYLLYYYGISNYDYDYYKFTLSQTSTLNISLTDYISSDETLDSSDTYVIYEDINSQTPLAADGSYTITRDITLANTGEGQRYLVFVADRNNNQGETNENNNIRFVPINITPSSVNQTPILTVNNGLTLNEAATGTITLSLLQVTDTDNTPTQLTYTLTTLPTNGTLKLNNNTLALNAQFTQEEINNNLLTYTHNGSETISDRFNFTITDGTNTLNDTPFGITINPVNDVPVVLNAIAPQIAEENQAYNFTFAQNTFTDIDPGDSLTYTATLTDGSVLPVWLTFNATERKFTGTPTTNDVGTYNLKVKASDLMGAFTENSFSLTVVNHIVTGSTNSETVTGTNTNDYINGEAGRDNITGGDGDDIVVGGVGSDDLTGGNGADIFRYTSLQDAGDIIKDFELNKDKLDFSQLLDSFHYLGSNPMGDGYISQRLYSNNTDTMIMVDADGTLGRGRALAFVRLEHITPNQLQTTDFIF